MSSIACSLLSAGIFRGDQSLQKVLEIGIQSVANNLYPELKYVVFCAYTEGEVATLRQLFDELESEEERR